MFNGKIIAYVGVFVFVLFCFPWVGRMGSTYMYMGSK